ncbi:hypothetical protein [Neomegalonema sp.]|uniref:hypothetical protein n=1 Tax=Neomegalonema sp. TaxID=2039713 RepID=UPI002602BF85|nr:hypothetical protein [Neomegalonema sp.]MDD2867908.1 hypothetical protein [Neomegalonema sp.]
MPRVEEIEAIRHECRAMIRRRAATSAILAAAPLPGVDVAADMAMLMNALPQISREFGLAPEQIEQLEEAERVALYGTIKGFSNSFIARAVTRKMIALLLARALGVRQAARFAPVLGQAAAAAISYRVMTWILNKHVEECYAAARAVEQIRLFGPGSVIIEGELADVDRS